MSPAAFDHSGGGEHGGLSVSLTGGGGMVKVAVLVGPRPATTGSPGCIWRRGAALRTRGKRPRVSDRTERPRHRSHAAPKPPGSPRLTTQVGAPAPSKCGTAAPCCSPSRSPAASGHVASGRPSSSRCEISSSRCEISIEAAARPRLRPRGAARRSPSTSPGRRCSRPARLRCCRTGGPRRRGGWASPRARPTARPPPPTPTPSRSTTCASRRVRVLCYREPPPWWCTPSLIVVYPLPLTRAAVAPRVGGGAALAQRPAVLAGGRGRRAAPRACPRGQSGSPPSSQWCTPPPSLERARLVRVVHPLPHSGVPPLPPSSMPAWSKWPLAGPQLATTGCSGCV